MTSTASGRLAGKVCFVTGAGSGIGRATSVRLAKEGARVACIDVCAATETLQEINSAGDEAATFAADVSNEDQMQAVVAEVVARWGRIDCAYANAGIPGAGSVVSVLPEHWHRVIAVNLTGVWITLRCVAPIMIAQRSGSVIAQASVAAFMGFEDAAPYAASKGGVIALARQAAVDLGKHGIRVNSISPGMVPTSFLDQTIALRGGAAGIERPDRQQIVDRVAQAGLLGRTGTPDEIASLVVFLASDESRWITGTDIVIDGGLSAR